MDHHADLVQLEPESRGDLGIENGIHNLHFQKVVATAECATLLGATLHGMIGDIVGIAAVDAAKGFCVLEIAWNAEVAVDDKPRSFAHQSSSLSVIELVTPSSPGSRRY